MRRGALAAALVAAALIALAAAAPAGAALPTIKHVFIVTLENEDAQTTFGPGSKAPYLAHTLRAQGAFVPQYFATGHLSLDNYIAMVSGQGPNEYTQADAPLYVEFVPGVVTDADGQSIGKGSIYPAPVKTVANQLDVKGLKWRGYMEDMGNSATQPKTCRHPAPGSADSTQQAHQGDQYAMRHNPFVYFHSIIDDQAKCDANVVPLTRLPADLTSASKTPSYSFISPNLCHDGHDSPCVGSNEPGGLVSADGFLKKWIPRIVGSPAYKDHGLVIVLFDEAATHDASSCCGEKQGPNSLNNGGPTPGTGGGRTGAVLLSRFIKPGTQTGQAYNHYSLLRSTEDMFGLAHLGYAGSAGLRTFGTDIYTNPGGKPKKPVPKPTVSLTKPPQQCVRRKFQVTATATGSGLTLTVSVDGHVVRSSHGRRITLTISAGHSTPGRHRIVATATDRFGRRATASREYVRCASA